MSDFIRTCPIGICLVQAGQECVCLAPLPPSDELSEPRPRGDKDEEDDSSHRRDQARKDGGPSIVTDEMVMRFLNWPLPESVCADSCTTEPGLQNRIGTNLLTELEARQMLEYVLALGETGPQESAHQAALAEKQARIDALMLEYCPDEMSAEQVAELGQNQLEPSMPADRGNFDDSLNYEPGFVPLHSGLSAPSSAPAGTDIAVTPETDAYYLELYRWKKYARRYGRTEAMEQCPIELSPQEFTAKLERQRDEALRDLALNSRMLARQCDLALQAEAKLERALKIVALARKCVDLDGITLRGMKAHKGPLNYLADALDAYDAAIAREKASK